MSRPRKRSRFARILTIVTGAIHLPFSLAAAEAARMLSLPHASAIGPLCALALFGAFWFVVRQHFPDRPRSPWALHLIDEPYFAHWCAALGSAIPIAVYTVAKGGVLLALGRRPEPPTTFALAAYSFFLAVAAWGVFVRRRWVLTRELDVVIRGLPVEFDGYKVAQLSDLHIGGLTPRRWGEAWVRRSNAAAPNLVVVTGDLVTSGVAFHGDIAQIIGALKAEDGVLVAMGNHDYFGEGEPLISMLREKGAVVLRNQGLTLTRGEASIFVAGVDDTWTRRANVEMALADRTPGATTVVLSHDPDLFPFAARLGVDLVLSGHTHGGQVAFPFLAKFVSLAKFAHRFHLGIYREGDSTLYVHPGLGTTGPPIRLGVAPEVAILTLRAV